MSVSSMHTKIHAYMLPISILIHGLFITQGNYDEATEYFSKAYNISRALGDSDSTSVNRVQYGIAMAHRMMGYFANHVVLADKTCMSRLLDWKSVRTDDFNKPIPDTGMLGVFVFKGESYLA